MRAVLEKTLLGLACLGAASPTQALPAAAKPEERSLRSSIGVGAAKPLLRAEASDVRRRAFERLGNAGTARALELLARALDIGGAARDARERLAVVRALAPHAAEPTAQDALIRALGGIEDRSSERDRLVEQTAALALAASRHPLGLAALARALRQPGRVSEAARTALTAHPPPRIEPLLLALGAPTPALVELLGELGDAHARPLVERLAQKSPARLQAPALEALARLDRTRAVELARATFSTVGNGRVRAACARVLALAGTADAGDAVLALLAEPATQTLGLDIALEAPSPALGAALAAARPDPVHTDRLLAALGRAGGRAARGRLERALGEPDNAWSAAYALALSPDDDADAVLEKALGRATLRRDAARAAVLRVVVRGRRVSGLDGALEALSRGDSADRAASTWCGVVLEPARAGAALASGDASQVRAAARQAFTPEVARLAARRLESEKNSVLRAALATALADPDAAELVPTATLVELFEGRGPGSYLAAYALARRDDDALRPRLLELMESDDPLLRVHVALGLGASTAASVVGLLADAYRFEVEPRVRRALVRALAGRAERAAASALELAATLEPDSEARTLARRALERRAPSDSAAPLPLPPADDAGAWIRVLPPPAGAPPVVLLTTPGGLTLPLAADADGSMTVAALPRGDVSVTLVTSASSASPDGPPAASRRDAGGAQ
jgi:hypothetical protein